MGANGGKNSEESKEAGEAAVAAAAVAELMLQLVKCFNADYKCHTHTHIHTHMGTHRGTHMCAHTQWQKIIRKLHWTTTSPTMTATTTTTATASFRLLRSCPRHDKRLQSGAGVRGEGQQALDGTGVAGWLLGPGRQQSAAGKAI